ncbi:MAG: glycerol kinase GlpK [Micrococcales bacterium]|nr:glycerol kinase GlpK [Micrococcales bacterium]MCL2667451.1 glycerol kinase GlpK [Micrococcales bacterium]
MAQQYILAVDQGTTSTRAMVFDHDGAVVAVGQIELRQVFPRPGWVEHDPVEIWASVREVVGIALARACLTHQDIAAVGVTNQRETTVVWDRTTGEPVHNAIVWQDVRTADLVDQMGAAGGGPDRYRERTGLPLATYFAGPKTTWILDEVPGAREAAEAGRLAFGTVDTWLLWNLTGGTCGGVHVTDVTNASRTMLMDLRTLEWDTDIAAEMRVPVSMLPQICSSSQVYGRCADDGLLAGVRVAAVLGDQQAAMFGQACFEVGQAKSTYGTGSFMLLNTGTEPVASHHGLLTTVCYQLGDAEAVYALEGSVAVTGSLVQWLRDNLGIIAAASEIEPLAASVPDNGGVYIVPAFSGLFAPHWRSDARGTIVGLTRYATSAHMARAALEATAFQTRELLDAMNADRLSRAGPAQGQGSGALTELRVDGGMVANDLLMQLQADVLGVPVVRPTVAETTALGAAYAAGIAVGFWSGTADVASHWSQDQRWTPQMPAAERDRHYRLWRKAVTRSLDWVDDDVR